MNACYGSSGTSNVKINQTVILAVIRTSIIRILNYPNWDSYAIIIFVINDQFVRQGKVGAFSNLPRSGTQQGRKNIFAGLEVSTMVCGNCRVRERTVTSSPSCLSAGLRCVWPFQPFYVTVALLSVSMPCTRSKLFTCAWVLAWLGVYPRLGYFNVYSLSPSFYLSQSLSACVSLSLSLPFSLRPSPPGPATNRPVRKYINFRYVCATPSNYSRTVHLSKLIHV